VIRPTIARRHEEAFGPVLPIMRFDDLDSVIARANATPYGLGASVWSRDIVQAEAIAARLDAGVVWINEIHHMSPLTVLAGANSPASAPRTARKDCMNSPLSKRLLRAGMLVHELANPR